MRMAATEMLAFLIKQRGLSRRDDAYDYCRLPPISALRKSSIHARACMRPGEISIRSALAGHAAERLMPASK